MTNARILLMRHSEKTGDPMDPHLSLDGYARAAKFADFIPATFGIPQFLIATPNPKHSVRPIETLEPLSTKIGVVLKSGIRRPVSQTNSILRWHSRSRRRLDCTRL